ncbi:MULTISPECIES: GlsB/YeaQ/YmgE family stress response membrane protein [unclassified Luteococcus]|uniref:GlsB/YeaQ/YmgE family stress response membrane protein n=1 Tax=unclassified Luteococcus TaxID=2639923 RepID=UPI00313D01CF
MGFIATLVLGLIAGALAKLVMPGKQGGGIIVTMLLGVVGAFVGSFLGSTLFNKSVSSINLYGILMAVVGSLIVLAIWGFIQRKSSHV